MEKMKEEILKENEDTDILKMFCGADI